MDLRVLKKLPLKQFTQACCSPNFHRLVSLRVDLSSSASSLACPCPAFKPTRIVPAWGFSTTSNGWMADKNDQHPVEGKLIYVGSGAKRIKSVQAALYTIGGGLILASPMIIDKLAEHSFLQVAVMGWLAIFGVGNPYLFYQFSKRYVLELHHHRESDKYTATTISPFLFGSNKIVFSPEECRMPAAPTPLASFFIKKRPLLVSSDDMNYFDYSKMLRYASEFDYENPDRQSQYSDAIKDSIQRISKIDEDTRAAIESSKVNKAEDDSESKQNKSKVL